MTTRKTVLFSVAFLLLILVIYMQFWPSQKPAEAAVELQDVVIAKDDIPPFTLLSADHLTSKKRPATEIVGSYGTVDEAVGQLTTTEIRQDNIVYRKDVIAPDPAWGQEDTLIFSFYVPTDRIVGGQLRPGHHIDLLATRPETRDQTAESLWLARDLWVVGVYQASGADVTRPTIALAGTLTPTPDGSGRFGLALEGTSRTVEGPANLVVLAAHRETARMIGDYLGARLYNAWVYVRPNSSTGVDTGQIDGIAYNDLNADLVQERNEPGLDDVSITLYDPNGKQIETMRTVGGGRFTFPTLEPGSYYVEEQDPEGYTSISPNRVDVYVAPGEIQHIVFADNGGLQGQGAGGATSEPMALVSSPTPGPTAAPPDICGCSLTISDRKSGAGVTSFPAGTTSVWAMVQFNDCPDNLPYTVVAYSTQGGAKEHIIDQGTWSAQQKTLAVEIPSWEGDAFADGTYATLIRTGVAGSMCDLQWWSVGAVAQVITPTNSALPEEFPVTGFGFGTDH